MPRNVPVSATYIPPFPWDLDALPYVPAADVHTIPDVRGLYFFRNPETVLYIGLSVNIGKRLRNHERLSQVTPVLETITFAWLPLPHATSSLLRSLETLAIGHYAPPLNREGMGLLRLTHDEARNPGVLAWIETMIEEHQHAGRKVPPAWPRTIAHIRRNIEEDAADA